MFGDYRLTTIDNPYDPFEQFTSWYLFDVEKHYFTCSLLSRLANITDDMSQDEVNEEMERVIDEIIKQDPFNIYKKVKRKETNE